MLKRNVVILTLSLVALLGLFSVANAMEILYWHELQEGLIEHVMGNPGYTLVEGFPSYQEAPELAAMVAAGTLPPVEERLPLFPVVLPPNEEIGSYGGELKMTAWSGNLNRTEFYRWTWEHLLVINAKGEVVPDVAKAYEWNDDRSALTIYLREGMKWSDGQPFTADDIMFVWEDYFLYSPDPDGSIFIAPNFQAPDGSPIKVTKVDDYCVRFEFGEPRPQFIFDLATGGFPLVPKHALVQYHPKYNGKTGDEALSLYDTFIDIVEYPHEHTIPTLRAWVLSERIAGDRNIYTRNPYYWKVDPEGNQLPYLDRFVKELVLENEMKVLRTTQGEYDIQYSGLDAESLPVLLGNRERGNYQVVINPTFDQLELNLNWNTSNEQLRELIHNPQFRRAISLAINREQFNDLVTDGLWRAGRTFISPSNPYYDKLEIPEEWINLYADYDVERANQMLDELGLKRGADGIRRYPGTDEKIAINFMYRGDFSSVAYQLVEEYMLDIGIELHLSMLDSATWASRLNSGNYEATIHPRTRVFGVLPYADRFFARQPLWAPKSGYLVRNEEFYEAIPAIEELHALWEQGASNPDPDEQDRIIKEALRLYSENVYNIGIIGDMIRVGVVKNNVRNASLEDVLISSEFGLWGVIRPEQIFKVQ